jgi:hypothetical protein
VSKRPPKPEFVTVRLPVLPRGLYGFHQPLCSAKGDGFEVEVTGGFGLGNAALHVSVNGDMILEVDAAPLCRTLIETAVERWQAKQRKKKKP